MSPSNIGYQDVTITYSLKGKEVCETIDCAQEFSTCEFRRPGDVQQASLMRDISMRIHYPTEQVEDEAPDDSKDRDLCQAAEDNGLLEDISVINILTGSGSFLKAMCTLDVVRVTGTWNAEPAAGTHPIVLFSSADQAIPHVYTYLLQGLVRRGFIVVAFSHPCIDGIALVNDKIYLRYQGTPPNADAGFVASLLEMEDARAGLDMLEELHRNESSLFFGKLDLQSGVGYLGHSIGGGTSILTAVEEAKSGDNRIRACLDMDGAFVRGGRNFLAELGAETETPFMLMSSPITWSTDFIWNGWQAWRSLAQGSLALAISFSGHFSYSDVCAAPRTLVRERLGLLERLAFSIVLCGWVDPNFMHELIVDYTSAFFHLHLLNDKSAGDLLRRRRLIFFAHQYKAS